MLVFVALALAVLVATANSQVFVNRTGIICTRTLATYTGNNYVAGSLWLSSAEQSSNAPSLVFQGNRSYGWGAWTYSGGFGMLGKMPNVKTLVNLTLDGVGYSTNSRSAIPFAATTDEFYVGDAFLVSTHRPAISSAVFMFQVVAPVASDGTVTIDVGIFAISADGAEEDPQTASAPLRRGTAAECTSKYMPTCSPFAGKPKPTPRVMRAKASKICQSDH